MAIKKYPLANIQDLEKITTDLTRDTVQSFYPSWYTEHWLNFETGSGDRLTFRFERPGYIGTIIGSETKVHYFESKHQPGSAELGTTLAKTNSNLTTHSDGDSSSIRAIADKLIGGKRITDVQVVRGDASHADYVKIGVEDGSYGAVAFLPGTLIAVEYHGREGNKVFGVEGKELGHRRLKLVESVISGRDVTYTDPNQVRGDVYIIPDFAKEQLKPNPKKLPRG